MRQFHSRKHPRSSRHDYAAAGYYFVTTVTASREPLFGSVGRMGVRLTPAGAIVARVLDTVAQRYPMVTIDAHVVMPDHVHAIIAVQDGRNERTTVSDIVGWIKGRAAHEIHLLGWDCAPRIIWQSGFYDRIIRSQAALDATRRYIVDNPMRAWMKVGSDP